MQEDDSPTQTHCTSKTINTSHGRPRPVSVEIFLPSLTQAQQKSILIAVLSY